MKTLDIIVDKVLSFITIILYFLMIVVVLCQIAARYAPSLTLSWTEELTRFLFVFIICLGAPLSLKYNSFADVDLFYDKLPKKIIYFINFFIVGIFNIVLIYSGIKFTQLGKHSLSPALHWPMFIHHSSVLLLGVLTFFYCILKLIQFFQNKDKAIAEYESQNEEVV